MTGPFVILRPFGRHHLDVLCRHPECGDPVAGARIWRATHSAEAHSVGRGHAKAHAINDEARSAALARTEPIEGHDAGRPVSEPQRRSQPLEP